MSLVVELERDLPAGLPAATATVAFCAGACVDTERRITRVTIIVAGARHAVAASGMPRPDLVSTGRFGAAADALHSGFWATVPVATPAVAGTTVAIELEAVLDDGTTRTATLGQIAVLAREPGNGPAVTAPRADAETIAICMATHQPDLRLLRTQIDSLRRQSDGRWICVISDDCSSPARYDEIRALVGDDPRFAVSRSEQRLGFYRNFERAMQMVPASAGLVALCDQDDNWHPDKLAALRAGLRDAILVYSDLRLVEADGRVLRDTLWRGRANNHRSLTSLLVANTITGAATLFRRELLELALPFPDTPGFQFHDAWLAVMALAAGRVSYVDAPLYDYVQHPGAVFGDVTHGRRGRTRRGLHRREWATAWRAAYFHGFLAREAQAKVALQRCRGRLDADKRRELERFVACDHSPTALARLALRSARVLGGHTETLGSELGLACGVMWKQLALACALRRGRTPAWLGDASIPPPQRFSQTRLRRWRSRL